jgi:glycosyltransferase involved in cell wall biosynthesis
MKINLFGQRNILGGGVHYSSFANALRRYTVLNEIIYEWDSTNEASLAEAVSQTSENDINIWFLGPHRSINFFKGKNIVWAIFETDLLPRNYIEDLLRVDLVWTPSNWAKSILVANGLPPEKINVVPEGVDQNIFHPFSKNANNSGCYSFLAIGKYEQRKGYDQLLQAFKKSFGTASNVQLLIKADFFIDDKRANNELNSQVEKTGLSNIKIIRGALDSKDLLILYSYVDGFVLPSRAEGWGLTLVEALACGLPTATVNYSGQTEYLSKIINLYLPIKHKIVPIDDPIFKSYWPSDSVDYGNWAEADIDDLAIQMTDMVNNQAQWNERALEASAIIRTEFNWSKSVDIAIESLIKNQILHRPMLSISIT